MGSSGGGKSDNTIRHSDYLERSHKNILDHDGAAYPTISVFGAMNSALGASPYGTAVVTNPSLYLGAFDTAIFPTLADMFGKFMAGLDIEILWTQLYEESVYGPEVNDAVAAHATYLRDDLDTNVMPKLLAGFRDINAVMSSSFVNAKAIAYDSYEKAVSKFRSELSIKMVDITQERWKVHLDWNTKVITTYADILKLYCSARMDTDTMDMDFESKNKMWDLNTYEYGRAMLGALGGGGGVAGGANSPSQVQKSVTGALSGAAMGATVGGPWGAAIGGAVGLAASFF